MNLNRRSLFTPVSSPRSERLPPAVSQSGDPRRRVQSRVRRWLVSLCLIGWFLALPTNSSAADASADESIRSESAHVVLVIGAAGTDEYGQAFHEWAKQWRKIAEQAEVPITVVGDPGDPSDPGDPREVDGEASGDGESETQETGPQETGTSDRQRLQQAIESLSNDETSPLWIVLIGHGTFTRGVAKFNLRGPDVSAEEMSQWLAPVSRPVVLINCASSSSPFINRLSAENRVIVTATRSGTEQNYARFGKYFAQAMTSPTSDLDHDDEVSVHEAFLKASAEVREFYETEDRIATEHALIDDNGDGKGSPATMFRGTRPNAKAKDGSQVDGARASRVTLAPAAQRLPLTEQELKGRDDLERSLDQLRQRKAELDPSQYQQELESLLVKLARIYQAAESRQQDAP